MENVKGFNIGESANAEKTRNLIVFTDPGIDDAIAINELLRKTPKNVAIYLCPVAGNVDCDLAYENAVKLATPRVEAIIDARPFDDTVTEQDNSYCGTDGLGDCVYYNGINRYVKRIRICNVHSSSSIINLTLPTDLMVLSPCKIPLLWLQESILEGTAKNISAIYMMGGCEVIDNMNGYEFNQSLNVEAFYDFLLLAYECQKIYNTEIYIATLDSCESSALDMYNLDIDSLNLPPETVQLYKAGLQLVKDRGEDRYFIYDLTIVWKYLEEQGVYTKQFTKRTHLLKGTNIDTPDIVVSKANFKNPLKVRYNYMKKGLREIYNNEDEIRAYIKDLDTLNEIIQMRHEVVLKYGIRLKNVFILSSYVCLDSDGETSVRIPDEDESLRYFKIRMPKTTDKCAHCGKGWNLSNLSDYTICKHHDHESEDDTVGQYHINCLKDSNKIQSLNDVRSIISEIYGLSYCRFTPIEAEFKPTVISPPWYDVYTPHGKITLGYTGTGYQIRWETPPENFSMMTFKDFKVSMGRNGMPFYISAKTKEDAARYLRIMADLY